MADVTVERLTQKQSADYTIPPKYTLKMKAASKVLAGTLVCLDAGFAKKATAAASLIAAGKAMATVDNTSGASGDLSVDVEPGVFLWDMKSGDELTQADVGGTAYMTDNHTVQKTSTTNSAVGKVIKIESSTQCWVQTAIGL